MADCDWPNDEKVVPLRVARTNNEMTQRDEAKLVQVEDDDDGPIEVEEYLQACPKCSSEDFVEESTEVFGIADRSFGIVCRECGFA
jgi:hypothetical protein